MIGHHIPHVSRSQGYLVCFEPSANKTIFIIDVDSTTTLPRKRFTAKRGTTTGGMTECDGRGKIGTVPHLSHRSNFAAEWRASMTSPLDWRTEFRSSPISFPGDRFPKFRRGGAFFSLKVRQGAFTATDQACLL